MALSLGKALLIATRPLQPFMPRMQPELIIIGAQKAGTTTLYELLSKHPRIVQPRVKEVSFFSSESAYAKGMNHYRSFFPRRPVAGLALTFDASPMYLYHESTAERIARHLPRARCLAVLRHPVERAYSAWNMYHRFNGDPMHGHLYDPRPFAQAVEDELSGKAVHSAKRYLDRGRYMPQLERYLHHVGGDRLRVESFETLKKYPASLVNPVLIDLGLSPFPSDHPAFGTRSNAREYGEPLSPALKRDLISYFADDARAVHERFGIVLIPEAT